MKMKWKNKSLRIIALWMILVFGVVQKPFVVFAAGSETTDAVGTGDTVNAAESDGTVQPTEITETIYIDTEQDLLDFAKKCTLDTWSLGKEVVLRADISLANIDFLPIPVFAGVFDGNGHQITGIDIGGKMSPAGLFGVVQESAVIKNLNISGNVHVSDDNAGGIAGVNHGLILNCSFDGALSGKKNVGGIAGTNETEGTIQNCRTSGNIQGGSMSGGVAGRNMGVLSSCDNRSNVNIVSVDPGVDINEMNLDLNRNLLQISTLDTVNVATDTGGIVGYSSGMVLSCTNEGIVGYQHIGYNVGGIAGRNSGYVFGCKNQGEVFGRKDIGGIVGQAEPDILLNLSADKLEELREELNKLNEMVSQATEHTSDSSAQISSRLTDIGNGIDTASAYAKGLSGQLTEYGDSVVEEMNRGGVILSDIVEQLSRNGDKLTEVSVKISEGIRLLEQAVRELAQSGEFGEAAAQELKEAADDLAIASELLESGMGQIAEGLEKLREAVTVQDEDAIYEALEQIERGSSDLSAAMEKLGAAMGKLAEALETDPMVQSEVIAALRELGDAFADASSAVQTIIDGINKIQENITMDSDIAGDGLAMIQEGLQTISRISEHISQAAEHIRDALENMELASGEMKKALVSLTDALAAFGGASVNGTEIVANISSLLSGLKDTKPIQIAYPSEAVGSMADALYDSLGDISGDIKQLNTAVSSQSDILTSDFRKINDQFMVVMNLMLDMVHQMENGSGDEMVLDTSGQDIDAIINGKVLSCENNAFVYGDINVGGIAGTLAVEYEFDPEDDIAGGDAAPYRREYELKAILQNCMNSADITGRRDYVGGICGRMDLGLVMGCEGYGTIKSENGDYVGGISGFSTGTVRGSFSKCSLEGRKYIGGIVGGGGTQDQEDSSGEVLDCYSMVNIISYEQYAGAVAGIAGGDYEGNYFVSDSLAGISRYSVTGQAEPIAYDDLLEVAGLPNPFRQLTVRFMKDEELLKQFSLRYGDGLEQKEFPNIPEREGYFSLWSEEELNNLHFDTDVEALYIPYETALHSKEMREDGREVFFVEGQFDDKAQFTARQIAVPVQKDNPDIPEDGLPERDQLKEYWQLDIPEDGSSSHMVRYLSSNGKPEGWSVYVYQDGIWESVDVRSVGSYLEFEAAGNVVFIAIVRHVGKWLWAAILLFMFSFISLFFWLIRKRKKGKRRHQEKENMTEGEKKVEKSRKPAKRKKKYRVLLMIVGIFLILGLVFATYFYGSGKGNAIAAYRLLQRYADRTEASMDISVRREGGTENMASNMYLYWVEEEGQRIFCVQQFGAAIYFCDGIIYLDNGKAFQAGELFPDYSILLSQMAEMYNGEKVSVYENNDKKIYSISVEAEKAIGCMESWVPMGTFESAQIGSVNMDLVSEGGELSEIRIYAEGEETGNGFWLQIQERDDRNEIPAEIRRAVMEGGAAEELPEKEYYQLWTAWNQTNTQNPLAASLYLDVDCGPVRLQDDIDLFRAQVNGVQVGCIRKNGLSVYFTENVVCDEDGIVGIKRKEELLSAAELLEIAYALCMNGEMTYSVRQEETVYSLSLDETGISTVAKAILPEIGQMDVELTAGNLQVTLEHERITDIRFVCQGSVPVMVVNVPVTLSCELTLEKEGAETDFTVPEAVLRTLERGK